MATGAFYDHAIFGSNYRLGEFQAAILMAQFKNLDQQTNTRNENGIYLNEKLSEIPGINPIPRGHGETRHAYHLYQYRYNSEEFGGVPLNQFLKAVNAEGLVTSGGYKMPLYKQTWFQNLAFGPYTGYKQTNPDLSYKDVDCPVCEEVCANVNWVRQQTLLGSREDMDDVVNCFAKVYEHRDELSAKQEAGIS